MTRGLSPPPRTPLERQFWSQVSSGTNCPLRVENSTQLPNLMLNVNRVETHGNPGWKPFPKSYASDFAFFLVRGLALALVPSMGWKCKDHQSVSEETQYQTEIMCQLTFKPTRRVYESVSLCCCFLLFAPPAAHQLGNKIQNEHKMKNHDMLAVKLKTTLREQENKIPSHAQALEPRLDFLGRVAKISAKCKPSTMKPMPVAFVFEQQ